MADLELTRTAEKSLAGGTILWTVKIAIGSARNCAASPQTTSPWNAVLLEAQKPHRP